MCHSQPPRIPEEVARTLLPTAKKLLSEQAVDVSRQKRCQGVGRSIVLGNSEEATVSLQHLPCSDLDGI